MIFFLTLITSHAVYFCTRKNFHVNIFHSNNTAMVSSQLFFTHAYGYLKTMFVHVSEYI